MPIWEQLATDQTDPWQVVPRHVFLSVDFNCVCCCQTRSLSRGNRCATWLKQSFNNETTTEDVIQLMINSNQIL